MGPADGGGGDGWPGRLAGGREVDAAGGVSGLHLRMHKIAAEMHMFSSLSSRPATRCQIEGVLESLFDFFDQKVG